MNAPHRITLRRRGTNWHATHSDPRIAELFGTATLPTAWRSIADAETVRAAIAALNPSDIVEVST